MRRNTCGSYDNFLSSDFKNGQYPYFQFVRIFDDFDEKIINNVDKWDKEIASALIVIGQD